MMLIIVRGVAGRAMRRFIKGRVMKHLNEETDKRKAAFAKELSALLKKYDFFIEVDEVQSVGKTHRDFYLAANITGAGYATYEFDTDGEFQSEEDFKHLVFDSIVIC